MEELWRRAVARARTTHLITAFSLLGTTPQHPLLTGSSRILGVLTVGARRVTSGCQWARTLAVLQMRQCTLWQRWLAWLSEWNRFFCIGLCLDSQFCHLRRCLLTSRMFFHYMLLHSETTHCHWVS